ncbi:dTDP-4-dehydrorhamnose reductase family protein [Roseateles puraquae]|uniref:dTDP-4-dehydrorhamnose reductase n=1 Tax=Roseateles puraquae TaxID=431059 RepID=A0A254N5R3_9BURK|nr:SDR family oxidoreductase [Roseateles puraquae]MDG0855371.1 SDR family oxidoreductase [Roseateles puraquae]OWR03379.1 NAD(P)-dependent oxidoreductase [Roseateles puraquae]
MTTNKRRLLVLGASGMLGNAVLRVFAADEGYEVYGSVRSAGVVSRLQSHAPAARFVPGVDVESLDSLTRLFAQVKPDLVVNCIGIVKQLAEADDPLTAIPINALLPHRLARLAQVCGARLIHVSTDCVFSGAKGGYLESDPADAQDLYGRSKLMGEVDYDNAVTLRTSIIGHELASAHGLVGWFLSQTGPVRGFTKAVFSGLPTVELARVMKDVVAPHPELRGTWHVSAEAIDKYSLLKLVAAEYGRDNLISPDDKLVIDRSLDSSRFRAATGYAPPSWPDLVRSMRAFG